LDALKPITAINVTIDPKHLSITLSQVVFVLTLVDIPALPIEFAIAVFLVPAILTLELVANPFNWCGCSSWVWVSFLTPFSLPVLHSI